MTIINGSIPPAGGGATYTAGTGINISSDNVISIGQAYVSSQIVNLGYIPSSTTLSRRWDSPQSTASSITVAQYPSGPMVTVSPLATSMTGLSHTSGSTTRAISNNLIQLDSTDTYSLSGSPTDWHSSSGTGKSLYRLTSSDSGSLTFSVNGNIIPDGTYLIDAILTLYIQSISSSGSIETSNSIVKYYPQTNTTLSRCRITISNNNITLPYTFEPNSSVHDMLTYILGNTSNMPMASKTSTSSNYYQVDVGGVLSITSLTQQS